MEEFVYPSNELQDGHVLLDACGSFWSSMYAGRALVEDNFFVIGQLEQQTFRNFKEAEQCVSRLTTPIWHTEHWYSTVLLRSSLGTRVLRYGDGAVYGNDPVTGKLYKYGGLLETPYYLVPIPAGMVTCPMINNRITDPSLVWTLGVDYDITEDGFFAFRQDPFATGMFSTRQTADGDEELQMWLSYSQWERHYLRDHHGWLIGIEIDSSQEYKDLINATIDAAVQGTSDSHVARTLAAVTGVRLAGTSGEIVESITNHNDELVIVTDKDVYNYPDSAEAVVSVGTVLRAGDPLVDSLTITQLGSGEVPADLMSIALGPGMLATGYIDGVTFRNTTVDVVVEENVNGRTKVSFELGGFPADVDRFWDQTHARGVVDGATLANLLDVREDPPTEPNANNLPATINPLEFLVSNLLRFNAYVIRIKTQDTKDTGLDAARVLRKIMVPWKACILIYEMEFDSDSVIMDGPGDENNTGYSEDFATLDGMDAQVDGVTPAVSVSESFLINQVTVACR